MKRKYAAGQIVWVTCADRNGQNSKLRPLLILQAMSPRLQCLCISTDPKVNSSDPAVEIPWDGQGMAETGLTRYSRVVLLWQEWVEPARVQALAGRVSEAKLEDIRVQRETALSFKRP